MSRPNVIPIRDTVEVLETQDLRNVVIELQMTVARYRDGSGSLIVETYWEGHSGHYDQVIDFSPDEMPQLGDAARWLLDAFVEGRLPRRPRLRKGKVAANA